MNVLTKTIVVREQELFLSIGVHDHERGRRQRLIVSVEIEVEGQGAENDEIARTFDYDKVHDFIKAQVNSGHDQLQETVARRVLEFILSCDGVIHATVETRKPDIFEDCAYVGVRLEGTP